MQLEFYYFYYLLRCYFCLSHDSLNWGAYGYRVPSCLPACKTWHHQLEHDDEYKERSLLRFSDINESNTRAWRNQRNTYPKSEITFLWVIIWELGRITKGGYLHQKILSKPLALDSFTMTNPCFMKSVNQESFHQAVIQYKSPYLLLNIEREFLQKAYLPEILQLVNSQ